MAERRLKKNRLEWADLHEDILLLIKGKLKLVDQLCFRAVCRSWRSVSFVRSADKLPWVVAFRSVSQSYIDGSVSYNLFNPSNGKEYHCSYELKPSIHSIIVYGSKYGWVFLAAQSYRADPMLFLYHVFSMQNIDLPALKGVLLNGSKGTFSTNPTCSDCVFCVIHNQWIPDGRKIRFSTHRNGESSWMTFDLEPPGPETIFLCNIDVIYRNGSFFVVFDKGLLWEFNTVSYNYQPLRIDTSEIMNTLQTTQYIYYVKMIESDSEFLLVYYCKHWKPWYIFKLDWSLMAWVRGVTLCNRALFLGATSFSVQADGEIKSLAGRIYYRGTRRYNYYYFKNSAIHKSSRLRPLTCKYYSSLEQSFQFAWVEPYL